MLDNEAKEESKLIIDMEYDLSYSEEAYIINEKNLKQKSTFQRNPDEYLIIDSDNKEQKRAQKNKEDCYIGKI